MATINLSSMTPKVFLANLPTNTLESPRPSMVTFARNNGVARRGQLAVVRAAPEPSAVEDSIKNAQETCSESPESGECAAAWDEVEEISAAASHARDRQKENSDPLETYCKDNPETDECRTYDN